MQHLTALHWTSLQIFASQEYITQCSIDCTVFYWLSLLLLHHCNVLSVIALYLFHCIALHCIALHCIALHCAALYLGLHVAAFRIWLSWLSQLLLYHCNVFRCHWIVLIALRYIALHCITLHCTVLLYIWEYTLQHFVFDFHDFLNFYCIIAMYLGVIELYLSHCIALYCIALHCAALYLGLHVAAVRIWL